MKQLKRLLSLSLALVLTFCTLSMGLVVHAEDTADAANASSTPFASLKVGGKAVDTVKCPSKYTALNSATSTQVEWTLNEGWVVTSAYYYDSSMKEVNIKSGDKVKVPKNDSTLVAIHTVDDTSDEDREYQIELYNGKAQLLGDTIWMSSGSNIPFAAGLSMFSDVVSIKSSNTAVLTVKKSAQLYECSLIPKKPGSSKVTVVLNINGEKKTFSATFTVKKYPNALTSLKVAGKAVNLKKNKFSVRQKVTKDKTKLEFKLAKGWKLKSCSYYDTSAGKYVKVKSGGTVKTTKSTGGAWVVFTLTKGSDLFIYDLDLSR